MIINILTGHELDEYARKLTLRHSGETDSKFRERLK